MNRKYLWGTFCGIACELIFGFSFMFTKKVTNTVPLLDLLAWRFLTAAVIMDVLALCRIIRIHPEKEHLRNMLILGLIFPCLYFVAEAGGIALTTASEAGIIIATVPAIALLLSIVFLKERPGWLRIAGIVLSIAGVIVCVLSKSSGVSFNITGYLLLLLAVISFCVYTILCKMLTLGSDLEKTFFMLQTGAVVFVVCALLRNLFCGSVANFVKLPLTQPGFLTAGLYLGVGCSVIAFFLCNTAISLIGPARTASYVSVETIATVLSGIIFLHEPFTIVQLTGTVIVIAGVWLANRTAEKKRSRDTTAPPFQRKSVQSSGSFAKPACKSSSGSG